MREFLISKFVCSACGEILNIEYAERQYAEYCDGEPTGAAKVDQIIKVKPCKKCKEEYELVKKSLAYLRSVAT